MPVDPDEGHGQLQQMQPSNGALRERRGSVGGMLRMGEWAGVSEFVVSVFVWRGRRGGESFRRMV